MPSFGSKFAILFANFLRRDVIRFAIDTCLKYAPFIPIQFAPLYARFLVQLFLTCLSCLLETTNTISQDMGLLCVEKRMPQVGCSC